MPLLASLAFRIGAGRRFLGLGLLLLLASVLTSAPPAFAQYSDYGSSQSSVTINWGALDALGPAPKAPSALKRDHATKPAAKAQRSRKVVLHRPARHAKKTARKTRHPAQTRTAASAKHRVAHTAAKRTPKPAAKITPASTAPAAKPTTAAAPAPTEPTAKAAVAPAPATAPASAATAVSVEAAAPSAPAVAESAPSRPLEAPVPLAPASEPHLAAVAASAALRPPAAIPVAAPATVASAMNSIDFAPGASDVPSSARAVLDALAARLVANDNLRLQVVAYATGNGDEANQARRLSLARAIAVRAYLIEKGVSGVRMDVRALGNRTTGPGPADRVDLLVLNR